MSSIRAVSGVSDGRFSNKDTKLMKTLKFPKEYDLKVDFNKVNWEVMKGWIAKRVTELLGLEDEVVIGYVFEQLENKQELNPKQLQINLTGFLEKNTSLFVKELWVHLHSANSSQSYIPQQILDQKAEELKKRKEISDQINESLAKEREKRKAEEQEARDKEAAEREKRRGEREERERKERQAARERERQEQDARRKRADEAREKERALRRDRDRERDRDRDRRHRDTARVDSPGVKRARYARSRSRDRAERMAEERPRQRQRSPAGEAYPLEENKAGEDVAAAVIKEEDAVGIKKEASGAEDGTEGDAVVKHKDKKHKKEKKVKKEKKDKKEKKERKHKKEKEQADSDDDEADRKALEEELREQALLSRVKS